jgi:transcriptional regulator with XRE-family HTH domain
MKKQRRNQELLNGIAMKIKRLREEKGLSQESLYIDTDINIARIELGKVNISVSTLQDICDCFEISLSDFFKTMDFPKTPK